jgi:murein DD-endopeptidase MepM/ murein hydrolase activator NlpD
MPLNLEPEPEGISNRKPATIVNKAKLGQYYLLTPLLGPISAQFDPNKKHFGVDILGAKNAAIKAVMDGYVISSDWTLESGNTIAIQHANNIVSFYKHNSSLLKKAGSFVQAGEAIAIIGNSGTLSDGPHLHFELWYNGHPVNPTEFINF